MSRPGVNEFICEDCQGDIVQLGYHDGRAVCGICRFIRGWPDCPEDVKARLRGTDQPTKQ